MATTIYAQSEMSFDDALQTRLMVERATTLWLVPLVETINGW